MKTFLLSVAGVFAPAVAMANMMGGYGDGYGMMGGGGWGIGIIGGLGLAAIWLLPFLVDALLILAIMWLWKHVKK